MYVPYLRNGALFLLSLGEGKKERERTKEREKRKKKEKKREQKDFFSKPRNAGLA